ncbi:MAG: hypothetical protein GY847_28585 [Proteobacteria bacterium]|nr:hypothetical protein [Pseudomonadota bacterium]
MSYGLMLSANGGYLPFANALLNSIEKRGIHHIERGELIVYLVHYDNMPPAYLEACKGFPFEVIPIELDPMITRADPQWTASNICKRGRYYYLKELGRNHDVMCLMDADLFFVSRNFVNLFSLIKGTDLLLGCNERFKWIAGPKFTLNNQPIFKEETRLHKFHCNTPVLFDTRYWEDVIDDYLEIVFRTKELQIKSGVEQHKVVGDLFSWNFAVHRQKKDDKVVLFPMETMAQVHQTAYRPWTQLECREGHWTTYSGEEVFSLHGRCGKKTFGRIKDPKKLGTNEQTVTRINQLYRNEWNDLSFNQRLKISDFMGLGKEWLVR